MNIKLMMMMMMMKYRNLKLCSLGAVHKVCHAPGGLRK